MLLEKLNPNSSSPIHSKQHVGDRFFIRPSFKLACHVVLDSKLGACVVRWILEFDGLHVLWGIGIPCGKFKTFAVQF